MCNAFRINDLISIDNAACEPFQQCIVPLLTASGKLFRNMSVVHKTAIRKVRDTWPSKAKKDAYFLFCWHF